MVYGCLRFCNYKWFTSLILDRSEDTLDEGLLSNYLRNFPILLLAALFFMNVVACSSLSLGRQVFDLRNLYLLNWRALFARIWHFGDGMTLYRTSTFQRSDIFHDSFLNRNS